MPLRKLRHDEIIRATPHELQLRPRFAITLVVDNVRSLYNIGSIFRSCDGALVDKIFLCGFTPHPPRKEISKTALGAEDSVPWEYSWSIADVLQRLKSEGKTIAALEHTDASVSCFDLSRSIFPLAIVVGNEVTGISPAALELSDMAVEIPMFGVKQSLNVAVATGVILYECVRLLVCGCD